MPSAESLDDIIIESKVMKAARLTFLGSLFFWPLFLVAAIYMVVSPIKTATAEMRRHLLIYSTWLYPVAVGLAWYVSRRGAKQGWADILCLVPWLLPTLVFCYWLGYFLR